MPGLYTHITRASGTILTATIYNSDHQNHIDNHIPTMIDDYSVNLAQMQTQVDPGELGTENLATDLAGEIARFRFALKELKGTTYWYQSAVNLALISSANAFTQPQTITVPGNLALTLISTDAGAATAPTLKLFRDSSSPAIGDELGQIDFTGRNSAGVDRTFGFVDCIVTDTTNTSEDSQVRIVTSLAGSQQAALIAQAGIIVGSTTVDKGVGTLNASAGLFVSGHGTIAQHQVSFNNTYTTLGTILPQDDTIPQITEGDQVLSVTVTPVNANSRLWIVAQLNVGGAASLVITAAIFRTGFSDATNAASMLVNASTTMEQVIVCASYDALDTTARTYTVRAGSSTATDAKLNGDNTNRNFGGASVSRMDLFEILPQ